MKPLTPLLIGTVLTLRFLISHGLAQTLPLLPNGNLEVADPKNPNQPAHWDTIDGLGIQWTTAPNIPGTPSHGKAIRINTNLSETQMNDSWTKVGVTKWIIPHPGGPISETYGISLYSDPVPLVAGKAYRISFDFMSERGTAGKVWFRGYKNDSGDERRLYEGVVECNSTGKWAHYTGIFHPTKHNTTLTYFKVMLYAFYPAGVTWFDNVTVEQLDTDPSP